MLGNGILFIHKVLQLHFHDAILSDPETSIAGWSNTLKVSGLCMIATATYELLHCDIDSIYTVNDDTVK